MKRKTVAVVDYGSGNLRSVSQAVQYVARAQDVEVRVTAHAQEVLDADRVVLPGQGHMGDCMRELAASGLLEAVLHAAAHKPLFGVCVGMQMLFARGVEFGVETAGCGQWPGSVVRLDAPVIPHMGWNVVDAPAGSVLFKGMATDTRFYFVHSYATQKWEMDVGDTIAAPLLTWADHGGDFLAAVENGPLSATQFHPEKSGDAGAALLKNWIDSL